MAIVNRIVLIGHLGNDPIVKMTSKGKVVTVFNMATNQNYRVNGQSGEIHSKTVWHRVVVFGKLGETVGEQVFKGDKVFVEGSLDKRQYEDKEGQTKYIYEIKAYYVETLKKLMPKPAEEYSTSSPQIPLVGQGSSAESEDVMV